MQSDLIVDAALLAAVFGADLGGQRQSAGPGPDLLRGPIWRCPHDRRQRQPGHVRITCFTVSYSRLLEGFACCGLLRSFVGLDGAADGRPGHGVSLAD